jgi:hypothetical protein
VLQVAHNFHASTAPAVKSRCHCNVPGVA